MSYPSCNVQRKSSCKAQLLIRTRIKISLNKYKERVHEGEQPRGTGSRARVRLRRPSPCGSPRQIAPRAGQLRTGPAASCHCSYRRHLQTERAAASLWSGTSAATWPSRYCTRAAQRGPGDWVPYHRITEWFLLEGTLKII